MKNRNPILLSLLGLAALFPMLFAWEFLIEPYVFNGDEADSDRWELIALGMISGGLALATPLFFAIRDQRRRMTAEAFLKDTIDTIPDGFVLYDPDGRLIMCNKRFRDFYGYSEAEAAPGVTRPQLGILDARRGVSVDGRSGEDYRDMRRDFRAKPRGEQEVVLADGRSILARERVTTDGGLVSVQTDISELKAVQAALAESERHLREALENISDAFVYFDGDGKLILCNDNYRRMFGYTHDEVMPGVTRQELGDIDESRGNIGPPEVAEAFRARRRAQLIDGAGGITFQLADGRWILSRARTMEGGAVVSILTDVTELKNAEARINDSEQLLRDAIESLEEGFIYFDRDDRLVVANSRYKEMYPAQRDIQPGTTFEDAVTLSLKAGEVPLAQGNESEWMAQRLFQHRELQHREIQQIDEQHLSDGRWVKISERRTAAGGTVGLRTDITELKDSQLSAIAANRAKTEFLAHMSHELRTPLNSIIGFSEVMREQIFGELDGHNRDYADNIHQSGVHLLALINDILDISRIEVGELQPMEEEVDVTAVITDCLAMMRPRAIDRGLALKADIAAGLPVLRADTRHLKQVLINLLSNAVKFTARGGQVVVTAQHDAGTEMRIAVADNGIGIPAEDQARLFEPFSRIENPEALTQDGTGLGLYLVRSLVELSDGRVDLVSAPGDGTTVTVRFPADRLGNGADLSSSA